MSSPHDDDHDLDLNSIFTEPPRPPSPEPSSVTYFRENNNEQNRSDWNEITIRLVGSHPLWGHFLWNASLALASYLDSHVELYRDKVVLELGAGGALPSIVAALNGVRKAVITDYPDRELLENIQLNVARNVIKDNQDHVEVQGYIWGHSLEHLFPSATGTTQPGKFDLVLLSDLIFNHSQHDALIETCNRALSPHDPNTSVQSCVLVFYTHHRPHLAHKDMEFFTKAEKSGWQCKRIITRTFPPMFPNDPGEESIRSTVHGWKLTRNPDHSFSGDLPSEFLTVS